MPVSKYRVSLQLIIGEVKSVKTGGGLKPNMRKLLPPVKQ
jgi:hypothetical protein